MSNNQAGKGDKLRKGADLKKYWDNYDRIFKNKQKNENHIETTSKDNTNK